MKKFMAAMLAAAMLPVYFVGTSAGAAVWGDANGDGYLDVADAAYTLQSVLRGGEYIPAADVDGNGMLDSKDAAMILQKILDNNYKFPVEEEESTTEVSTLTTETTTETTTEVTTVETTVTTTEETTVTTTETTTESTTETTTEATTVEGVISSDHTLKPDSLESDKYFVQDGDFSASNATRIRITDTNSLKFSVAKGANIYITASHASSTTSGTRTLKLTDTSGKVVGSHGYEMGEGASESIFVAGYKGGTLTLSADNHINVTAIRITFDNVTTTTEATTEATTRVVSPIEVPSEITTTGNAVYVSNYSELVDALEKTNVDVYIQNDIECTNSIKLSSSNARVNIIGVTQTDGTAPSIDFAKFRDSVSSSGSSGTGFRVSGSGYSFENVIIENAPDCGIRISGSGTGNCFFKNCIFRYNNNSGVSITNSSSNNTFIAVDSYRNGDLVQKLGADADGFSVKLNAGNDNYFYNCRAWENSDDGWDSYDRGTPYIGDVYYIECLAWNNGNPDVFTGEYDYKHGYPLDKNLLYVKAILNSDKDFETKYNNKQVTEWPNVTVRLYSTSQNYNTIHSSGWGGNPNGFKFGSAQTPSSSYRYVENCIAFDHEGNIHQAEAKGYDQNSGSAKFDIINGLSFDNVQNYWMDKMTALSQQGQAKSFGGELEDTTNDSFKLTTPDTQEQESLRAKVHAYKDALYNKVYNDIIPGEVLCDVFN